MKKAYSTPDIAFESFALSVSIAACKVEANHNAENECGYKWDAENILFLENINGCTTVIGEGDDSWDGYCYHNHSVDKRLFGS